MIIKGADVLITNANMKKMSDNTEYCSVGILTIDDGQKFDVSVRDANLYKDIKPMTKAKCDMELTNSKYGLKLTITKLVAGAAI